MKQGYKPLHPEIFTFDQSFLDPMFREAMEKGTKESYLSVMDSVLLGVFSCPMFTQHYCNMLIEELENMERNNVHMEKPNSMNIYGAILNDLGFSGFFDGLMAQCIIPLSGILFAEQGGTKLKYHHSFTVGYKMANDKSKKLDLHVDDSDITLNVCLGKEFTSGDLLFKGFKSSSLQRIPKSIHPYKSEHCDYNVSHTTGHALIHRGDHQHQATPITSGERVNLIVWCKATPFKF